MVDEESSSSSSSSESKDAKKEKKASSGVSLPMPKLIKSKEKRVVWEFNSAPIGSGTFAWSAMDSASSAAIEAGYQDLNVRHVSFPAGGNNYTACLRDGDLSLLRVPYQWNTSQSSQAERVIRRSEKEVEVEGFELEEPGLEEGLLEPPSAWMELPGLSKQWQKEVVKGKSGVRSMLYELKAGAEEVKALYQEATATFVANLPGMTIDKVSMNVNPAQLHDFDNECKQLKSRELERKLPVDKKSPLIRTGVFHGAEKDSIFSIQQTGFRPDLAGAHGQMHGVGTYFALDASYSHGQYSKQDPVTGHYFMWVCRIACGRSEYGMSQQKKLPALKSSRKGDFADSFTDSVANPSMFVMPRPGQSLPLYLIEYH